MVYEDYDVWTFFMSLYCLCSRTGSLGRFVKLCLLFHFSSHTLLVGFMFLNTDDIKSRLGFTFPYLADTFIPKRLVQSETDLGINLLRVKRLALGSR